MNKKNLRNIDLNLMVVLNVLLEEKHITRSAKRLNLSQPAMSKALNRLRATLDDRLLIRDSKGYQLTHYAESIQSTLASSLHQIEDIFHGSKFDPSKFENVVTIATSDYGELNVLPSFMKNVTKIAPECKIKIISGALFSLKEIVDDTADLILGLLPNDQPKHCQSMVLYEDRFVCVMDCNHPIADKELTLEDYVKYPHSTVESSSLQSNPVDSVLKKLGMKRRIAKTSPHFISSLISIRDSELLLSPPRSIALAVAEANNLCIKELPFDTMRLKMGLSWHAKKENDPAHKWIREQLLDAAKQFIETDDAYASVRGKIRSL